MTGPLNVFVRVWELSRDDDTYESDLEIAYRRA